MMMMVKRQAAKIEEGMPLSRPHQPHLNLFLILTTLIVMAWPLWWRAGQGKTKQAHRARCMAVVGAANEGREGSERPPEKEEVGGSFANKDNE